MWETNWHIAAVHPGDFGTFRWQPEYAELARKVCDIFGAVDIDTAAFFGVSIRTLRTRHHRLHHRRIATGGQVAAVA
jgi:hypothetical protein